MYNIHLKLFEYNKCSLNQVDYKLIKVILKVEYKIYVYRWLNFFSFKVKLYPEITVLIVK